MKILIGSKALRNHIHNQDDSIRKLMDRNTQLEQQVLDVKDETIQILRDCKGKLGL